MTSPVIKIKVDGTVEYLPDEHPDLDTLQEAVGGWIEVVPTTDGRVMVLDEEGKLKGKKPNPTACKLYGRPDPVVGDVVVMPDDYLE